MIDLVTIRSIFERHGLGEAFREQEPLLFWPRVAGESLTRLTSPLRVNQGVLYVEVSNHVIAQELSLMKDAYLKKINELLGESRLEDIRFRVGLKSAPPSTRAPDEAAIQLSLLEREERERILDELKDLELREAFSSLMNALDASDWTRRAQGWRRCAICGIHLVDQGEICFNCQLDRGA